jgi:adenosylmethionine-8-amino-7-oxononanoate aminotransferase
VTLGGTTLQGIAPNREGFGPLVPDVVHVPHDDVDALAAAFDAHAGRVAAVFVEPVIAAGGVRPVDHAYLAGVRALCDSHGALLVADEVVCGFGRLGAWFGMQHFGIEPDLVTFAKGVTSGVLPLGGVLVGRRVRAALEADEAFVLRSGHTYSGHPTCAAAALANLDVLEADALLARAPHIGGVLEPMLRELLDGELATDVRGLGGMWAVDVREGLVAGDVRDAMLAHGVLARPLGDRTIAFCPPLVVTDAQLERCAAALTAACRR